MATTIGTLKMFLELDDRMSVKFDQAINKVATGLPSLERSAQRLQTAGLALTATVTAPIVGMGVAAVSAASKFESSFAGIIKTVDDATDATGNLTARGKELQDGMRQLAKEIPISVNELNRIGELGGQLGIASEDLLSFTRVVADLGATTNLSVEDAATQLARFANITGLSSDEFDRVGATIVDLGNNFATTEAEISEFGLRIAGAGKIAGLSEPQILAIGTAMTSIGVQAEAGGTSVQKVLNAMTQAVAEGGKELNIFGKVTGQTAGEFAKAFREDAGQAFVDFVEGLKASGDGAFAILDGLSLGNERTIRSFLGLSEAGDLLQRTMDKASSAWESNTALVAEAEKRYATFESRLTVFKSKWNDILITLGGPLLNVLSKVMEGMDPVIKKVSELAEKFALLPTSVQAATFGAFAFVAVLGPLAIAMSAVMRVGVAFGELFTSKLAVSLGKKFGGAIVYVYNAIKSLLTPAIVGVKGAASGLADEVVATGAVFGRFQGFLAGVGYVGRGVLNLFKGLGGPITIAIGLLLQFTDAWDFVKGALGGVFSIAWKLIVLLKDLAFLLGVGLWTGVKKIGDGFKWLGEQIMRIPLLGPMIGATIDGINAGFKMVLGWLDKIGAGFDAASETVRGYTDALLDGAEAMGKLTGEQMKIESGLTLPQPLGVPGLPEGWETMTGALAPAGQAASDVVNKVAEALASLRESRAEIVSTAQAWVRFTEDMGPANKLPAAIKDGLQSALQDVIDNFGSLKAAGLDAFQSLYDSLKPVNDRLTYTATVLESPIFNLRARGNVIAGLEEASNKQVADSFAAMMNNPVSARQTFGGVTFTGKPENLGLHFTNQKLESPIFDLSAGGASTFERVFGVDPKTFGMSMSSTMVDAIAGGGDLFRSVGAKFGQMLGSGLQERFAGFLSAKGGFGKAISGMLGSVGALVGNFAAQGLQALGQKIGGVAGGALQGAGLGTMIMPGIGTAVGAGLGALTGWIKGLNSGRKAVKEFAASFGGFDALSAKLSTLGAEGERLWKNLTQGVGRNNAKQAEAAIKAVTDALKKHEEQMQRIAQLSSALNLGFDDMTAANQIADLKKRAEQMVADILLLTGPDAGFTTESVVKAMSDDLNELLRQSLQTGQKLPDAMRPFIEELIRAGLVADDVAAKMLGLEEVTTVNWREMQTAAEKYGIAVGDLGPQFEQSRIRDIAKELIADWELLTEGGANVEAVIRGMGPAVQDVVTKALAMGLEVPAAMRPMLEAFLEMGVLTDENGEKLTDLSRIKFTETMEEGIGRVASLLEQLVLFFTGELPDAARTGADGIENAFRDIDVRIPVSYDIAGPGEIIASKEDLVGENSFAHGTGGYKRFSSSGDLALLHDEEEVVNRAQGSSLASQVMGAVKAAVAGSSTTTGGKTVNVTVNTPDADGFRRLFRGPAFQREFRELLDDDADFNYAIRRALNRSDVAGG